MSDVGPTLPPPVARAADRIGARLGHPVYAASTDDPAEDIQSGVAGAAISILVGSPGETEEDLIRTCQAIGLTPEFCGQVRTDPGHVAAILRGTTPPAVETAPPEFTVAAVLAVYNEVDIIDSTVAHLAEQGLHIYLIDNWSTDETLDAARAAAGAAWLGWERFPPGGPSPTYDWAALLSRVGSVSAELEVDWIVANDADEIRVAPWPGVTLRDALWHAQQHGANAVNYSKLNFALTVAHPMGSLDLNGGFRYFDPQRGSDLGQCNTWRRAPGRDVDVATSGGHQVAFAGRRVFPYNFLLKHYPIRSIEQGMRKINTERLDRYRADERLRDWHSHYHRVRRAEDVLDDPARLLRFDADFDERFLLERLTGVGFEPLRTSPTVKIRVARVLRRFGLFEPLRKAKWRLGEGRRRRQRAG